MKKPVSIILAAMFACSGAAARDSMTVTYNGAWTLGEFERELMEFQGVDYMEVAFDREVAKKNITITRVVCRDGEFGQEEMLPGEFEVNGVNVLRFFAQTISDDEVKVKVNTNQIGFVSRIIALKTDGGHILMETFDGAQAVGTHGHTVTYPADAEIPIVAYTTGREVKNGGFEGIDYCALRDAMVHPREWHGKFGIKNYVYYTVRFR